MRRSARRRAARERRQVKAATAETMVGLLRIDPLALAKARAQAVRREPIRPFEVAQHPPGVAPEGAFAMDEAIDTGVSAWAQNAIGALFDEGQRFLGWAPLALLAQRPEHRRIVETIATEATRKGIKIQAAGDAKEDRVKALETAIREFGVMDLLRRAIEGDGFFGRAHIYVDLGDVEAAELASPIGAGPDEASRAKVQQGKLRGFRTVEAMWAYPVDYDSSNPLSPHWYSPQAWYVAGKRIHRSRLLTFVAREVPDLLKPNYSFGGLALTQMVKPYVDNWLRTRESVSDLISAFSVMVLATRLGDAMGAVNQDVLDRADFFNATRDNRGLMLINKDTEDLKNVSAPLGTLDMLQAQSQEHMASVSATPLVKLLGITPNGLNASSEGEIRVFYDSIHAMQERILRPNLTTMLCFLQLHLWGEVDPEITFEFEPLWSMSAKELAEIRKIEADTDDVLVNAGAIGPQDVRERLSNDPDTPYHGLDVDALPAPTGEAEGDDEVGSDGPLARLFDATRRPAMAAE